jgi:hypothetical protein
MFGWRLTNYALRANCAPLRYANLLFQVMISC